MLCHNNSFCDVTQWISTLLRCVFHCISCVEMACETSDEYCFSSLHPVSFESSDHLFYCNHWNNTRREYTRCHYRFESQWCQSASNVQKHHLEKTYCTNWKHGSWLFYRQYQLERKSVRVVRSWFLDWTDVRSVQFG